MFSTCLLSWMPWWNKGMAKGSLCFSLGVIMWLGRVHQGHDVWGSFKGCVWGMLGSKAGWLRESGDIWAIKPCRISEVRCLGEGQDAILSENYTFDIQLKKSSVFWRDSHCPRDQACQACCLRKRWRFLSSNFFNSVEIITFKHKYHVINNFQLLNNDS